MPWRDVKMYLKHIPRLQAEELLFSVQTHAIGAGSLPSADSTRIIRQWNKFLTPDEAPKRATGVQMAEFARNIRHG